MNTAPKNVASLIDRLKEIAKNLDDLELSMLEKLNRDDKEANEILLSSIKEAQKEYTQIGIHLNDIGGYSLMQLAISQVPNLRGDHAVISTSWDSIGDWID